MPDSNDSVPAEDAHDSSVRSPSYTSTASSASSTRSVYPKKGKTRIPAKLINKRALIDLGYPFFQEGNTIIIQKALGQDNLDEPLKVCEDYKTVEEEILKAREPEGVSFQVPPNREESEVGTVENAAALTLKARVLEKSLFNPDSPRDPIKRPEPNQVLVSGFFSLKPIEQQSKVESANLAASNTQSAWINPKTVLEDGTIDAELFNVHAAEYYRDQTGFHKVTLCCPNRPRMPTEKSTLVKMRWLHLRGTPSNVDTLVSLVVDCPYVSQNLKSVALKVLLEVNRQCSMPSESEPHIESGVVIKYIGRTGSNPGWYAMNPTKDTEPVVFLSTPSLAVPEKSPTGQNHHSKTLLEFLYGYEAGSIRQQPFGAPRLKERGRSMARTLHVPETWFLSIGPDIVITVSELTSQEMTCNNVIVDQKVLGSGPGIFTVRVVDSARMCKYHIVIERDCNYANFLKHAIGLAQSGESTSHMYVLIDEQQRLVEPEAWIALLASGEVENHIFGVRRKGVDLTSEIAREFHALSFKLLEDDRAAIDAVGHPGRLKIHGEMDHSTRSTDEMAMVKAPGKELKGTSTSISRSSQRTFHHTAEPDVAGYPEKLPSMPPLPLPPIRLDSSPTFPPPFNPLIKQPNMIRIPRLNESDLNAIMETPEEARAPSGTIHEATAQQLLNSTHTAPEASSSQVVPDIEPTNISYQASSSSAHDFEPLWDRWGFLLNPKPNHDNDADSLDGFEPPSEVESDVDLGSMPPLEEADPEDLGSEGGDQDLRSSLLLSYEGSSLNPYAASIMQVNIVPFLTWRLSWDSDKRSPEDTDRALVQLLNKIHESLTGNGFGRHYSNTFSCTKEDVEKRCQMLTSINSEELPASTPQRVDETHSHPDDHDVHVNSPVVNSEARPLQLLFNVSEDILSLFLPEEGSSSAHPICNRFWGALDTVLRHIYLSSVSSQHFAGTIRVHVSPLLSSVRARSFDSSPAKSSSEKCSKILDDPCLGWVQWHGLDNDPDEEVLSTAVALLDILVDTQDRARDIHCSVSGPSESSQGPDDRPHLLSSLVQCFEDIIGKLVLTAKELSWMNRTRLRNSGEPPTLPTPVPLTMIRDRSKELDGILQGHLNLAKRDVMVLGTTRSDIDRLIISPVGSEFLLATLISNLQNNTILQGTGQKMDIIKHYRKVSTGLRFGAVRDPKRQRFLEISALEEELDAIRGVLEVQGRMVEAYRTILDPTFLNTGTTDWAYLNDRKVMYPLEKTHLDAQAQKLAEDNKTLEVLKQIAQATRHDMKQIIEVLEEGHGKAIRVFTFVTLFFLPLSFVTSFFGMNTTDIRDTDWDQRIFWSSAVPVTALVLALALIYGYKWDEVTDLFTRRFNSQRSPRLHDISEQDLTPLAGDANARNDKFSRVDSIPTHRAPWINGLARVKKRRQPRKNERDVPRRQTFDSLLA
ncbi:hypothetical protein FSARC_5470 [Fusarium sarcochroum]|uniref:DUF8035 domain-containing protein n=1 Tax=Fusarium sarcochroum TaxID=1208366 RepID=A0A8H4TZC7_9HYPO|nr:hypothetical protein FSARC_5470 [Fusarium sarcochroum]